MFEPDGRLCCTTELQASTTDTPSTGNKQELSDVDLESSLSDTVHLSAASKHVVDGFYPNNATTKERVKPFVYVVAATAALGSLVFGFSLTGAGGTFIMESFQNEFGWTCPKNDIDCTPLSEAEKSTEESLITSLQSVGSIFGALCNAMLLDRWGRKWTIFTASLIFIIGATVPCVVPLIKVLYAGRWIGGFGIGMLAMSVPIYISECAPSSKRGQLTTFWQMGVTIGMLFGSAVNMSVSSLDNGWRFSYGGPIVFAALLALSMATFMPESPRFVAGQGNSEQQREQLERVLQRIRYEEDIPHSTEAIEEELREERELGIASWCEIFRKADKLRYRVLLGIGMQFLNQLSGNETINFYAPKILSTVFTESQSLVGAFLLGVVNLVAVVFALFTVDRIGRVPLWTIGGSIMLLAQIGNSILQSLAPTATVNVSFLVCLSIFTFAYHGTMGPLAWDICSEMYPARERGKAVSLTTMSNFLGVVLVGAIFPLAMDASPAGCFAFFSVMLFVNIGLVYFFLPETAERSPLQIGEDFAAHKPKLIRNVIK